MNGISIKYEIYYEKAFFILALLFVMTLPCKSSINSFFIILLTVTFLFKRNLKSYFRLVFKQKILLTFWGFYLITVFSFFNSLNHAAATKEMVLKLPFFIFPVILGSIKWSNVRMTIMLSGFVLVMLAASLYSFGSTYYQIFKPDLFDMRALMAHDWAYFSFVLPHSINLHPAYYSFYLGTALLIIYYLVKEHKLGNSRIVLILAISISFYFLAFLALLSSRTSLFATLFVLGCWITFDLWKKGFGKYIIVFWLFVLVFLCVAYFNFPYLRGKLNNQSGISIRSQIWGASYQIIQDNFLLGVGTGDVKESLRGAYKASGFLEGLQHTYNAHNQFLQTAIALGFIGVVSLISFFLTVIQDGFRRHNMLIIAFSGLFFLCCLTESMLSRQHGVAIFCFFSCLLPFVSTKQQV